MLASDPEFVGYREDSWNRVGANSRNVLVSLIVHDTFQRHVPVLDDDPDRGLCTRAVAIQHRISIDSASRGPANLIVEPGEREDFNLIVNVFHTLDATYKTAGFVFHNGTSNFAVQRHCTA